ncbi:hypothetical protein TsFJ059_007886 [Trichoderma semiorbis]|uniref:Uncharacterized protein n=1 Tax=Trichoderma semiorbis TaxID=1491008 RepID=A0A9P8HC36_9HYPO|nr:hypothetical protein TsFJ059_007886 [Trichoderma semiorbis]
MPFTAEMALNSSFGSLMAEICAIVENQLPTESPQEDILQHGEDISNVTTTLEREQDTSQSTEQPCEEEEQGNNGEEEHTNKLVSLLSVFGLFAINSRVGSLKSNAHRRKLRLRGHGHRNGRRYFLRARPSRRTCGMRLRAERRDCFKDHIRTLLVRQHSPLLESKEVTIGGEYGRAKRSQRMTIGSLSRTILASWFSWMTTHVLDQRKIRVKIRVYNFGWEYFSSSSVKSCFFWGFCLWSTGYWIKRGVLEAYGISGLLELRDV